MWLNLSSNGVIGVSMGVGFFDLGAFFHVLQNLKWYCVGVGLTGCVSMWVLLIYVGCCVVYVELVNSVGGLFGYVCILLLLIMVLLVGSILAILV